jgi:hypothetical protein
MDCFDFALDARGCRHVLVVVEATTLFVWTRSLRTKRNEEVHEHLDEILSAEHLSPDIRSDNGTEFRSIPDALIKIYLGKIKRIQPGKSRSNVSTSHHKAHFFRFQYPLLSP